MAHLDNLLIGLSSPYVLVLEDESQHHVYLATWQPDALVPVQEESDYCLGNLRSFSVGTVELTCKGLPAPDNIGPLNQDLKDLRTLPQAGWSLP